MTTTPTDYRALCAELADALDKCQRPYGDKPESSLVWKARAALAQPEPQEQVLARVEFAERKFNCPSDVVLRQYCDDWFYGNPGRSEVDPVDLCRGAIKLFAQIPAPIPVSERWPEFSDCDPLERVWAWNPVLEHWKLTRINRSIHTHWLPHWALPLPESEAGR